jgi:molybdate transport system substrate-binding protein
MMGQAVGAAAHDLCHPSPSVLVPGRRERRASVITPRRSFILFVAAALLGQACGPAPSTGGETRAATSAADGVSSEADAPGALTVFAAASLQDAFRIQGKAFEERRPDVRLAFNFASSRALRVQIEEGAEADVFASASTRETDALCAEGLLAGDPIVFATNVLTIVVAPGNPAGIQTARDLARPGLTLVLAAEEVPAGEYARTSIHKMATKLGPAFEEAVLGNVVSNEDSVRQVLAKVALGEADAGIVYVSDVTAAPDLQTIPIPMEHNTVAEYPIAVLAGSARMDLAEAFVDIVLSNDGQRVLREWGFLPPPR